MLTLAGLLALASAMGIGRFAFTPMLPLMQAAGRLDLAEGAWLAVANYLGYLLGALACSLRVPPPRAAVRAGLLAVAVLTIGMGLGMGWGHRGLFALWLLLRFGAGVASACVLVGVAGAVLGRLAEHGRSNWAGGVFAGVGLGIAAAGWLGRSAGLHALAPEHAWLLLGAASVVALLAVWPALPGDAAVTPASTPAAPLGRQGWRLLFCYGGMGFGYIVPATFLPAAARAQIADPAVFGWVWPVFGLAAAASTVIASQVFARSPPRRLWVGAQALMAFGVLVSALWQQLAALLLCALCVGGSFMVATMAGLQEARQRGGAAGPRWVAGMTASFAAGQLAGPFVVGLLARPGQDGLATASFIATAVLLIGLLALCWPEPAAVEDSRPAP